MSNNYAGRALVLGLYSSRYPAVGESHGLSVVAGVFDHLGFETTVLDMVAWGEESCERAEGAMRLHDVDILAVGVPYGTFSILKQEYGRLRASVRSTNPLVVLGGPIPTYLGERILTEFAQDAVVVLGEAEESVAELLRCWRERRGFGSVPGVQYIDRTTGKIVTTPRRLVNLEKTPLPHRRHLPDIQRVGGQIFTEASRGCSWAACTFCLRGLTDRTGRSHEYRRKNPSKVVADLTHLYDSGVTDVTFADEDFLGSALDTAEDLVSSLEAARGRVPRLDASLTVHSVFSRRDDASTSRRRLDLLRRLSRMGMQRVFLGVESCSPEQLKRYAKGHTRDEAAAAAARIDSLGMRVEIGVILFDPLCTLDEVEDSLAFMRRSGLAARASGISGELRLQIASSYVAVLSGYERRSGTRLRGNTLDPDTLSYPYSFAHQDVADLHGLVSVWNDRLHPLYYPAKSLTRFGEAGALGPAAPALRSAIGRFRVATADGVLAAIGAHRSGSDMESTLASYLTRAAEDLAAEVRRSLSTVEGPLAEQPIVQNALSAATQESVAVL